jgi:hypothetical protein
MQTSPWKFQPFVSLGLNTSKKCINLCSFSRGPVQQPLLDPRVAWEESFLTLNMRTGRGPMLNSSTFYTCCQNLAMQKRQLGQCLAPWARWINGRRNNAYNIRLKLKPTLKASKENDLIAKDDEFRTI